ncbi:hypothetical protein [Anaerobiospirillum sp. NML120449]|uniref:hypothetical protein n=1 Tax=Anaerobiospirillum sp. NML120449 TaxID=2932817 RepID=UPI001FF38381|nr:hypothetical protein [Anaerobiospirillum sp. NML120449]MCK0526999.1 hypothetical protein [Anaerobiospirillum sp. NML120449]
MIVSSGESMSTDTAGDRQARSWSSLSCKRIEETVLAAVVRRNCVPYQQGISLSLWGYGHYSFAYEVIDRREGNHSDIRNRERYLVGM